MAPQKKKVRCGRRGGGTTEYFWRTFYPKTSKQDFRTGLFYFSLEAAGWGRSFTGQTTWLEQLTILEPDGRFSRSSKTSIDTCCGSRVVKSSAGKQYPDTIGSFDHLSSLFSYLSLSGGRCTEEYTRRLASYSFDSLSCHVVSVCSPVSAALVCLSVPESVRLTQSSQVSLFSNLPSSWASSFCALPFFLFFRRPSHLISFSASRFRVCRSKPTCAWFM